MEVSQNKTRKKWQLRKQKRINMEEALGKAADKLRGSVESAEYKHVVLRIFS